MISLGYFGDGPWAINAFKRIEADSEIQIRFVCPRHDTPDLDLCNMARDADVPILNHPNINSPDFLSTVRGLKCDLFVSMSFDQIFKADILSIPPLKTINCHAGKLPFYRGRNVLNWVLINDEKEFGITVHYIDKGIDTGDIIAQECHPIFDKDNYATLLEKAYTGCGDLLYNAIKTIESGSVKTIKQVDVHPVGTYYGRRMMGDEILEWNQTSREIYNFIRALCPPGPMARSFLGGREVSIAEARLIPEAPRYRCIPGQVVGKSASGIIVKTLDTTIELVDYHYQGTIKIGDRLN